MAVHTRKYYPQAIRKDLTNDLICGILLSSTNEPQIICASGWLLYVHNIGPGQHIVDPALSVCDSNKGTAYMADIIDQPGQASGQNYPEPMLQFFEYAHLPAHLQAVSKIFHDVAHGINNTVPRNPERTAGLRKLLEAKDCVVRAHIYKN